MLVVEAEVGRPMGDQRVKLREAVVIEQQCQAFAGGQLAAPVLLLDAVLASAELRLLTQLPEVRKLVSRRHGASSAQVVGPAGIEPATRRL